MTTSWRDELHRAVDAVQIGNGWKDIKARFDDWVENDPRIAVDLCNALAARSDPKHAGARRSMRNHLLGQLTLHPPGCQRWSSWSAMPI